MANQNDRRRSGSRPRLTRAQAEEIRRRQQEEAQARRRKDAARKKKQKRRRRIMTLVAVVLCLFVLPVAAFVGSKMTKMNHLPAKGVTTYAKTPGYTNIALFGLDAREGELEGGVNSDTIIIASINNLTKEVKLVSVYRDTYLQIDEGTYYKANAAYCRGGPAQALNMLNKNLDLNIKNYVSINFNALITTVDMLGGIDMDLTAEEAYWLDCYIGETSLVSGVGSYQLPDEDGGTYHLNGVQATAYCRIRYTAGDDFKRTERQRTVLMKILEKAKGSSLKTLNNVVDSVLPQVVTNMSGVQLIGMALSVMRYDLTATTGFPFDQYPCWVADDGQEMVVPWNLEDNVRQLHEFLFPGKDYEPGKVCREISDEIEWITGITGE